MQAPPIQRLIAERAKLPGIGARTGKTTALHIADALRDRAPGVVVTRLASGLP